MKNRKEQVAEEQNGFRSGSGRIDQVFVMKKLVEKYIEKRKELYVAFIDLEKAYNEACRVAEWRVLLECRVNGQLTRSMSRLYDGSTACVRFGSTVKEYLW